MNNNRLILILFLAAHFSMLAQQNVGGLCMDALSVSGKSAERKGKVYSYTVGEPIIFTLTSNAANKTVTQGFHQPDVCPPPVIIGTDEIKPIDWQLHVSPNPTPDLLKVRMSEAISGMLHANVYELLGRRVIADQKINAPEGGIIDCANLQPGIYFLRINVPNTVQAITVRFVKI